MIYPNWFFNNISLFKNILSPYFGLSNLKFLQIGAYTGDASLWLLENILIEQSSILIDVDTWEGSEENIHKKFDWQDIESIYDIKMSKYKNVIKKKVASFEFLSSCSDSFDFIYIDGDHTADGVYSDAVLSYPLLKVGGIMAFDDYLWHHDTNNPKLEPKLGIDKFLELVNDEVQIIHKAYQVWIKKL